MKNLVKYIEKHQTAIFKSFSLFSKEKGLTCGSVLLKVNYKPVDAKEAYAMPAVPKEAVKAAASAPAASAISAKEEAELLEDHAVQDVDESKDKVHFAPAVNAHAAALPLAAAALVAVLGLVAVLAGGKKAPPPPPLPPAKGKGGKK